MTIATSTRFVRPAGLYNGNTALSNYEKYRTDAAATPKVAISSEKVDGDLNYLINAINSLDDDFNGLVAGSIPDDSITDAKLRNSSALSVIGRSANTSGDPADIVASADHQVLRRNGTSIGFGELNGSAITDATVTTGKLVDSGVTTVKLAASAVTTAKVTDSAITFAKVQDIANQRVLGRNTTGAGVGEELTVHNILDWLGSISEGDIIYRGSTSWQRLAKGGAAQVLQMNTGATAPEWADPAAGAWEYVATVTASGNSAAEFTGLQSGYDYEISFDDVTLSGDTTDNLEVQVGTSTGPTWQTGASDYFMNVMGYRTGQSGISHLGRDAAHDASQISYYNISNQAGEGAYGSVVLLNPAGGYADIFAIVRDRQINNQNVCYAQGGYLGSTAVTAVRVLGTSGTISGNFNLYRRSHS